MVTQVMHFCFDCWLWSKLKRIFFDLMNIFVSIIPVIILLHRSSLLKGHRSSKWCCLSTVDSITWLISFRIITLTRLNVYQSTAIDIASTCFIRSKATTPISRHHTVSRLGICQLRQGTSNYISLCWTNVWHAHVSSQLIIEKIFS